MVDCIVNKDFNMESMQKKEDDCMEEVTIKEIAKLCGVGISTVSRAINNHPDINPETKDAILKTIKEYNYIPNNSARNLKRTDTKSIAILVKGMTNPIFSAMIKIMEAEIKRKKYTLVLHHVEFEEDEVDVALELIKEKRLRGIVFLGGHFRHSVEKLEKLTVPFVLSTVGCGPDMIKKSDYSSIAVDDEKESFKMTEYLIREGHKKIAILTAKDADESIGELRLAGYKRALKEFGIEKELICTMIEGIEDYSMENGYEMTKQLLESKQEFTAVYAISDTMAIGACKAILDAGKRIPEDYSVVGYDGIAIGRFYSPAITTIAQPMEEMARATTTLLFDVITKKGEHQHKIFPGELIIRESSKRQILC